MVPPPPAALPPVRPGGPDLHTDAGQPASGQAGVQPLGERLGREHHRLGPQLRRVELPGHGQVRGRRASSQRSGVQAARQPVRALPRVAEPAGHVAGGQGGEIPESAQAEPVQQSGLAGRALIGHSGPGPRAPNAHTPGSTTSTSGQNPVTSAITRSSSRAAAGSGVSPAGRHSLGQLRTMTRRGDPPAGSKALTRPPPAGGRAGTAPGIARRAGAARVSSPRDGRFRAALGLQEVHRVRGPHFICLRLLCGIRPVFAGRSSTLPSIELRFGDVKPLVRYLAVSPERRLRRSCPRFVFSATTDGLFRSPTSGRSRPAGSST